MYVCISLKMPADVGRMAYTLIIKSIGTEYLPDSRISKGQRQFCSMSSMLILLNSPSPVPVMMISMSVPIGLHVSVFIHARHVNGGKIITFMGVLFFTPSFQGKPSARDTKFGHKN